jgi:thioredoxin-like negative regulator of GroEL
MNPGSAQYLLCTFCALLPITRATLADTVVLEGKPPFRKVQVINFRHGRLHFRGLSKEILRKPLDEIARFKIDAFPMLSNAEALIRTDAEASISAYQQALEQADKPWLRDLIRARLIEACDRAGRFDQAVALFIELLREKPALATNLAPRHPGDPGSPINTKARRQLSNARESMQARVMVEPLQTLSLELLLFDDVDPLPPEFAPPASQPTADFSGEASPATQPSAEPPLLFGPVEQHAPAAAVPDDRGLIEAAPPRLPPDSFVLSGARQAFERGNPRRAARLLERALPYLADHQSDNWRLLLGRCRIELGQLARAADELLALAESTLDHSLAANALYYVGVAHERMDRADVAAAIYRELLQRGDLPAELRQPAQRSLNRLGE